MGFAARLNPPHLFTGERDGFSALIWLRAINRYIALAKIETADRTQHAISYLANPGPARLFNGSGLADTCNYASIFTPALKAEYISPVDVINEFIQTAFVDNCPTILRQMIEGQLVKDENMTLTEIFSFADRMDKIYSFRPDNGTKSYSSPIASAPAIASSFSSSSSSATPMDLDNIMVQFNNINKRLDNISRSNRNNYN
ncbi:hypothetical protein BGZ95_006598, partial [Linnemannia exigua]